jgi:hypothetical protein
MEDELRSDMAGLHACSGNPCFRELGRWAAAAGMSKHIARTLLQRASPGNTGDRERGYFQASPPCHCGGVWNGSICPWLCNGEMPDVKMMTCDSGNLWISQAVCGVPEVGCGGPAVVPDRTEVLIDGQPR